MSVAGTRAPSQQRERRYVVDYVRNKYPNNTAFFNLRIGAIPEKLAGQPIGDLSPNIANPWKRYADAIVITAKELILIEAKLPAKIGAVSQLLFYRGLIPQTPELAQYKSMAIRMVLVTAMPDPQLVLFANSSGIDVEIYQPEYAVLYLQQLLGGKLVT